MVQRNLADKTKPVVEITLDGDEYTMKTKTALKNTEITFKLGVEFEEETADGRRAKVRYLDSLIIRLQLRQKSCHYLHKLGLPITQQTVKFSITMQ